MRIASTTEPTLPSSRKSALRQASTKIAAGTLLCSVLSLCGCSPAETDTLLALQGALNSLTQNRALSEQFVRDVKANVDPSDPAYQQTVESYDSARESYNGFLDKVERSRKETRSLHLHDRTRGEVLNATADFLADATAALRPSVNVRRIPFQRAIVLPEELQSSLQRLPKRQREELITEFDKQVRWRSWSHL